MNPVLARGRRVAVALAAAALLTLAGCGDDDDTAATTTSPPDTTASTTAETTLAPTTSAAARVTTTTEAAPSTSTSVAATTTAAPATTTTSPPTTVVPTAPSGGGATADTPLSISGIGPIRAGMTLREALATGVPVSAVGFDDFEGFCYGGAIDGQPDVGMLVLAPGDQPPADPLDGVIGRVSLYIGVRPNTEGIQVGSPEQDVRDAYGAASLAETPHEYVPGGHYLRYEDGGGFAYVFETDGSLVTAIHAGDPNVVGYVEGCA